MPSSRRTSRAFSLIEMVMVVAIIAIVATIAIPRFKQSGRRASRAALVADLRVLELAVEFYTLEHNGRSPAEAPDGSFDSDPGNFVARLTGTTDELGNIGTGPFGPYLVRLPQNPRNGKDSVRIGGVAGSGLAGWHFAPARRKWSADDSPTSALIEATESVTAAVEGSDP